MTQGPVLTFGMIQTRRDFASQRNQLRYDLLASAEDLLDTWGPGQFVNRKDCKEKPCAVMIGGGIIYANDPDGSIFHWDHFIKFEDTILPAFDPRTKIMIGALVTVNKECTIDEKTC